MGLGCGESARFAYKASHCPLNYQHWSKVVHVIGAQPFHSLLSYNWCLYIISNFFQFHTLNNLSATKYWPEVLKLTQLIAILSNLSETHSNHVTRSWKVLTPFQTMSHNSPHTKKLLSFFLSGWSWKLHSDWITIFYFILFFLFNCSHLILTECLSLVNI